VKVTREHLKLNTKHKEVPVSVSTYRKDVIERYKLYSFVWTNFNECF